LSWRRNQLLVLHFYGRFLLTASLRRRSVSMYIFIHNFPEISHRQRSQYITHEFSEDFEATAYLFACVRELLACTNILRGYTARISLGKRLMFLLSKILCFFSLNFITLFNETKHRNGIWGNRRLSLIFKV
jgi:hypothetical protein